jgi:hypothetical protein
MSLTDPQARWTTAPGGPAYFDYSTNYLIDTDDGVNLDVEATPAHRTADVESTRTMVERVEAQFDLTPERLIGDTAYRELLEPVQVMSADYVRSPSATPSELGRVGEPCGPITRPRPGLSERMITCLELSPEGRFTTGGSDYS